MRAVGIAVAVTLFAAVCAYSQPTTLFNAEGLDIGGFGGPGVMYSTFNGEDMTLAGGFGAMTFNNKFYIGAGGWGNVSEHTGVRMAAYDLDPIFAARTPKFQLGYGGLMVGWIFNSDGLVHLAGDVTLGAGAVNNSYSSFSCDDEYHHDSGEYDSFKMVQPMAHAVVNVTSWMRVTASVGYRFVDGVSDFGLSNDDVSGPVAGMTLRFGSWKVKNHKG